MKFIEYFKNNVIGIGIYLLGLTNSHRNVLDNI